MCRKKIITENCTIKKIHEKKIKYKNCLYFFTKNFNCKKKIMIFSDQIWSFIFLQNEISYLFNKLMDCNYIRVVRFLDISKKSAIGISFQITTKWFFFLYLQYIGVEQVALDEAEPYFIYKYPKIELLWHITVYAYKPNHISQSLVSQVNRNFCSKELTTNSVIDTCISSLYSGELQSLFFP